MTKPKGNSERTLTMDKGKTQMLFRLFDVMYKTGVSDAASVCDSGLVREHIERCQEPGIFGRVTDDTSTDWLYFQITLEKLAYQHGMREPFMRFARNVGRYGRNYLSVGYVCALCWYLQGLADYEQYGCADIAIFNSKPRARLTRDGKLRNAKLEDWVSDTQIFCFKRNKTDREAAGNKYAMPERNYTLFTRVLSLAAISRYDTTT